MILSLPYPPTVNTYWRHPTRGKLAGRHLISEEGRAYRKEVFAIARGLVFWSTPCAVALEVIGPDRRARDLDNLPKAILDALTHAKVLMDDSLIWDLRVKWVTVGADKKIEKPGSVLVRIHSWRDT